MPISRPQLPPAKTPTTPQSIWYARCPTLTALGLIANRGVLQREFLRENVYIVSVRENSTPQIRQGHLDHTLPNLIREADAATAIWSHGLNAQSRLLALGHTFHAVSVVTRASQPIDSLKDLVGRRLSVPKEAGAFSPAQVRTLRAWETILALRNIPVRDIEWAPVIADHPSVPFGDVARREVEALLGGQTDVAILYGAKGIELARNAHLKVVHRFEAADIAKDPRLLGLVEQRAVTVDSTLLDARDDLVARVLGNLLEAADWATDFPKEALRHAALEGKVELDDAAAAYDGLVAQGAQLGLEPHRLEALESLHAWLKNRHLVPESHQIASWLRPEILESARHAVPA
ncbi:thermophilic desulfurizing enzyme, TdsB protein [Asticcacaulis sp. AC460]|uniref:ABC transporter substrate-binding protein n=1 Tax=Asticcacaulis sp. AC460 TaxID=1282360 RepID=UPI0003C3E11E|nr:thermophilic desulfurizing enzyme, TdsB protein [Asticcacaulis sp. AC460]ESQ91249.1 thermophilic desulfurizing enzyme, TdsB protein [Asticcacaulis sp. AC460]